ncbi:hypothetical protein OT109_19010 [Phycisphaeraceae bacterium D3-23]
MRSLCVSVLIASTLTLAGCQPRPIVDPVATATDPAVYTSRRVSAVAVTPDAVAVELMPLVLSVRHPIEVRRAAMERMIQADADRFWATTATNIRRINDWPMLAMLCERAADDGRVDFIPALVQSWARPSIQFIDADRPERDAIVRLRTGQTPEDLLWPLFQDAPDDRASQRVAQAAWLIMVRTHDREALRHQLLRSQPQHRLHTDLQSAASAVEHLPRNREEVLRLGTLCDASSDDLWDRRNLLMRAIEPEVGRNGVALRHLPTIDHADEARVQAPHRESLSRLMQRLASARQIHRTPPPGRSSDAAGTLTEHADALGWADLLVLDAILDAIADRGVAAALFEQAEQDRLDTTTEFGGVLTWGSDGSPIAQPFEPVLRRRDEEFIASDACVRAMHTGLAHYHFHAQRYDNADWAGPGGGDATFADNLHANCIVFTFIDRNTLNADAYFPGGLAIDLGCIER